MIEHQNNPQFYPEIVVSNTSVKEDDVKAYIELAEKYNFMVFSIIVENRHGGISRHDVPEKTVAKMRRQFNIKL